jgi:hypothetical protein
VPLPSSSLSGEAEAGFVEAAGRVDLRRVDADDADALPADSERIAVDGRRACRQHAVIASGGAHLPAG